MQISLEDLSYQLGLVRLFLIHMGWRGLIRIERYFDLLGIETPSIHIIIWVGVEPNKHTVSYTAHYFLRIMK
jgi:hypothetical protein